jgi:hypothetical protein
MNYCATNLRMSVLITMAAGFWTSTSSGAEDPSLNNPYAAPPQEYRVEARTIEQAPASRPAKMYYEYSRAGHVERPMGKADPAIAAQIRSAAEAVRDAKNDEDKEAAQTKLTDLLGKYFDDDMSQREKELTKIEERLTKLRELLERRREKKEEILDLQAKVALNEALGLGFYNTEPQMKGIGSGFGGAMSRSPNPWVAVSVEPGAEIPVPQATTLPPPTPVIAAPPLVPAAEAAPKK